MKTENKKIIQTFCGKELFTWDEWDEIDTGFFQFYNIEFCIDSMKKYNGMSVSFNLEGELEIYDKDGNIKWTGWVIDIPGFLEKPESFAGRIIYRVIREFDKGFGYHGTETVAICATKYRADEIVQKKEKGLSGEEKENYYVLKEILEG